MVPANPVQLRQVVSNLVGNALKFRGEGPADVAISPRRDGAHWVISVQDRGPGVPPESREVIFELFGRAAREAAIDGSGMGLAICRP